MLESTPRPPLRPFRFAVVAARLHDAVSWRRLCAEVERTGYSALYLPDTRTAPIGPLAALGAAAAHTDELRLGMLVANNDLRAPAVFAKELATLDVLSEGRLEWGLGAGWDPADYRAAGLALDPPGVRVDRLVEAVDLMQRIFSGNLVIHDGCHYHSRELLGTPAPVQKPHPPLLIGGAERRMLTFAGRRADIVSVNRTFATVSFGGKPARKDPATAVADQIAWIRAGAGARLAEIEISMEVNPPVVVTADGRGALADLAASTGIPSERLAADPRTWVGSVSAIVEMLQRHREVLGVSHWVVYEQYLRDAAPIVAELSGT